MWPRGSPSRDSRNGFAQEIEEVPMRFLGTAALMFVLAMVFVTSDLSPETEASQFAPKPHEPEVEAERREGRTIFRFDTFGDEQLWTDVLRMHEVIPKVDPATALA